MNGFVSVRAQWDIACYILFLAFKHVTHLLHSDARWVKMSGISPTRMSVYANISLSLCVCVCISSSVSNKYPQWGIWGSNERTFIRLLYLIKMVFTITIMSSLGVTLGEKSKTETPNPDLELFMKTFHLPKNALPFSVLKGFFSSERFQLPNGIPIWAQLQ